MKSQKNCPHCGRWKGRHSCPGRRRVGNNPRQGLLSKLLGQPHVVETSSLAVKSESDIARPPAPVAIYGRFIANSPSKSASPIHLDLSDDTWSDTLSSASIFEKSARVSVRPARVGEVITTVLGDGTVETSNTAEEGDFVLTNPGGESYLVKKAVLETRYRATENPGVFQAKGMVRAVPNTTGARVTITAPWGEEMVGDENCWIVEVVDEANPSGRSNDRYLIGGSEFLDTYRPRE